MCPSEHEWPASQHSVKWGRHQLIKEAMAMGSNTTLPKKENKTWTGWSEWIGWTELTGWTGWTGCTG